MENTELIKQVSAATQIWLDGNYDAETKSQVKAMLNNDDKTDLIDSFYRTLEFGTGGLRGIMGVGTNRMNIYTVGAATQGFANYLKKQFASDSQISVVIGHDCRNNSRKFAEISADILSANGIKVYLFDALRPTPKSLSPFGNSRLMLVSTSPLHTIRRNTTDTKPIGTTEHNSSLLTTRM